jgi:Tol biopolymer transport system component
MKRFGFLCVLAVCAAPAAASSDGRWIAFASAATNLVTGQTDGNFVQDVFLHDRTTGQVILLSHTSGSATTTASGLSDKPAMAADGTVAAFRSAGTNLIAGVTDSNSAANLFLYDVAAGTTLLVSRRALSPLRPGSNVSGTPALSSDGRHIAYASNNLITGQIDNGNWDVFAFDCTTLLNTLASHSSASAVTDANADSTTPTISLDGAWIAYLSDATNLVAGQTDANQAQATRSDAFVFDRAAGTNALASRSASVATTTANRSSDRAAVARDGGFVVFTTSMTDVVTGLTDANSVNDVFAWERATATNAAVSRRDTGPIGATGNGTSKVAGAVPTALSADGRWGGGGEQRRLEPRGGERRRQLGRVREPGDQPRGRLHDLVRHRSGLSLGACHGHDDPGHAPARHHHDRYGHAVDRSGDQRRRRGGGFRQPGDRPRLRAGGNSNDDVFSFDRATGNITLASRDLASPVTTGNGTSPTFPPRPSISATGGTVTFATDSSNLAANDINGLWDAFLFQP